MGVKRLWAESDRGAVTIVGGERSKGGLWFVRRGEVENCYLKSEHRSDSQPLIHDEEEGRDLYRIHLIQRHAHRSAHGSKEHIATDGTYYDTKLRPDRRLAI